MHHLNARVFIWIDVNMVLRYKNKFLRISKKHMSQGSYVHGKPGNVMDFSISSKGLEKSLAVCRCRSFIYRSQLQMKIIYL